MLNITKILGNCLVSIALYSFMSIFLFSSESSFIAFVCYALAVIPTVVIVYFLGVLFPKEKDNPLGQGISILSLLLVGFPLYYIFQQIPVMSFPIKSVFYVAAVTCFLMLSFRASEYHWEQSR